MAATQTATRKRKRKRSGSKSNERGNTQNEELKEKKEEEQNKEDGARGDKESESGEKEIEKMESLGPVYAEEMKGKRKRRKKKKKMEGRENGEDKEKEEEEEKKDLQEVKEEGKEEKKRGLEEEVNGEGEKEEGKKKRRRKKKKKGGLQMEETENGEEKKDLQEEVNKEEKEEGKEENKEVNEEEEKEEGKKKQRMRKKKKKKGGLQIEEQENGEEKKEEEGMNAEKEEGKKIEEEKKETDNNEATKKKKRRRKKKKGADDTSTIITTPPPSSPPGEKKRKKEQGTDSNKEEEKIDDNASPSKKMKIVATESDKDGTGKKKKKRKKKKGNAAMNESKDEGEGVKKEVVGENDDGKEAAMNEMNEQIEEEGENAKNKIKEENGDLDVTKKEIKKEDNKTEEMEKGEEKKGKKRRKKRKRKGNQSDSSAKDDEGKEKEEEEEEVPVKKMKKEETKENEEENGEKMGKENEKKQKTKIVHNTNLKNATQPNEEENKNAEEENENNQTTTEENKREEENKNQEMTVAENEDKNTNKQFLTASQKKKLKKKMKKAMKRQAVGVKETSEAPATATARRDSSVVEPVLHSCCGDKDSKQKIRDGWQGTDSQEESVIEGDVEVIQKPFLSCYIKNLLENEEFLEGVKKELVDIPLLPKNNDLYKFHQTPDLKGVTTPYISALRDFLYTDMRLWLQDVTGLTLQDTVDMGSSRYSHTDVLLCHDDVLEGRLIAYILYLVPPWSSEDGGTLDLFFCDESGQPKDIVRSLVPKNNAFAFFQVGPTSFHQVSEVLSRKKTRLSINGWFHGPPVTSQGKTAPPALPPDAAGQSEGSGKCSIFPPFAAPGDFEEEDFYTWINPIYLDPETQREIRRKFGESSEVALENFLNQEVNEKVSRAMWHCKAWRHTGPPNRQSYQYLPWNDMPQEVKDCQKFLQCEAFFLVLSQLTGLRLHPMAPKDSDDDSEDEGDGVEPNPRSGVEVQRWSHRCYTLLRDDDCTGRRSALDAHLFTSVHKLWREVMGGHISYIEKDEDEELLTVEPKANCLSLVYCDPQTLRFTKYINSASLGLEKNSHYYKFSCVYYE